MRCELCDSSGGSVMGQKGGKPFIPGQLFLDKSELASKLAYDGEILDDSSSNQVKDKLQYSPIADLIQAIDGYMKAIDNSTL